MAVNPSRELRCPTDSWMNCTLSNDIRKKNHCYCSLDYFLTEWAVTALLALKSVKRCVWPVQRTARAFRCVKVDAHIPDGTGSQSMSWYPRKDQVRK